MALNCIASIDSELLYFSLEPCVFLVGNCGERKKDLFLRQSTQLLLLHG